MRPARIAVFDGLRVSTEHVEHLQDSLNSSIRDFRELVGVGRVIRGFDVERADGTAILVKEGLAFDRLARRLVLDEPRRVEAGIPPGREAQYVCVEHAVVEDGEVEGRPTLIWDSVSVALRDVAPGPDDDALAVAKLVAGDAEGSQTFDVVPVETAGSGTPTVGQVEPPAAVPPQVRQGVARLAVVPSAPEPAAELVAALAARTDGDAAAAISVRLGSTELATDLAVQSLTSAAYLSATLERPDGTVARLEAVSHGEATLGAGVTRFGLTTVRSVPAPYDDEPGGMWVATDLSEDGIATLPLAAASPDATSRELLAGLRLICDIAAASPGGVSITCSLAWSGPADQRRLETFQHLLQGLQWTAAIGWKALGT